MTDQWYYTKDGKNKVGPFPFVVLQQLAGSGVVQPTDMVRQEGGPPQWVQAQSVPGLFSPTPVQPPPPQPQIQLPPLPPSAPAQSTEFPVDRSQLSSIYANYCQVIGLPEELLFGFGLNSAGDSVPTGPVRLTSQVVINYYTAKRLLNALAFAVNRHENFFGVLEVDVQKRIRTGGLGGPLGR